MNRVPDNNIKEHYSLIYLQALAIANGFAYQRISMDFFKTDIFIHSNLNAFLKNDQKAMMCLNLNFQLKATENPKFINNGKYLSFSLDQATYDTLRASFDTRLGLLVLPKDWNNIDPIDVLKKSSMYWLDLYYEYRNVPSKGNNTIHIPKDNVLTQSMLFQIMADYATIKVNVDAMAYYFYPQKSHEK